MPTLRRHSTTFNEYIRRNLLNEFNEAADEHTIDIIEENIEIIIEEMLEDLSEDEYVSDIEEMDWEYDTDEDIIVTEIRPWDVDEEN